MSARTKLPVEAPGAPLRSANPRRCVRGQRAPGSARLTPPRPLALPNVPSFPSLRLSRFSPSSLHHFIPLRLWRRKKKKKKGEPIKAAALGGALPPPQFSEPPPARPNYGQRRRAMGKGARFGLRNQQPARGSPLPILRIPPARSAYPGAGGGGEAEQGAAKFLPPSRRVAGLPCARGGDEPSGAGAARPQQVGSGTLLWSSPPTTHTPRSRVGRARGAAGSASPWGGTAPEISAHRATVTPPG